MKEVKSYEVVFVREADGGYSVSVPDLPGCATEGDTFEEAQAMAKEAIEGYLETLIERGLPIPEPSKILMTQVGAEFATDLERASA
jgi:predicted RNase H-like HicB family nuclease